MRSIMVLAVLAALLSGCRSSEDSHTALADAPPMPDIPAAPSGGETAVSAADQPDAEDALDAGMDMVAARDVCKLPAAELAKFAAYSEWVVQGDPQRKAIFITAAKEATKLHESMLSQGRQEAYRKQTCARLRRVLATIEQGIRTYPAPGHTSGKP
ncbi:hypothetical protein [Dyella sp. 2RAB6]|uniref:hypothetical protein n=1 Tax=Dyella sp. 2RAB6 TaxID=3232992 RepID=UPI003F9272D9